jgi:hypothetical protein
MVAVFFSIDPGFSSLFSPNSAMHTGPVRHRDTRTAGSKLLNSLKGLASPAGFEPALPP